MTVRIAVATPDQDTRGHKANTNQTGTQRDLIRPELFSKKGGAYSRRRRSRINGPRAVPAVILARERTRSDQKASLSGCTSGHRFASPMATEQLVESPGECAVPARRDAWDLYHQRGSCACRSEDSAQGFQFLLHKLSVRGGRPVCPRQMERGTANRWGRPCRSR